MSYKQYISHIYIYIYIHTHTHTHTHTQYYFYISQNITLHHQSGLKCVYFCVCVYTYICIFIYLFILVGLGFEFRASCLLYHLSHAISSPFCSGFWTWGFLNYLLGLAQTVILLISASQVARIIGMNYPSALGTP
jgi:hypothetical protein